MNGKRPVYCKRRRSFDVAWLCGWLIVAALSRTAGADTVYLADGTTATVDDATFIDGKLRLGDGRVVPRADIKKILFDRGASAKNEEHAIASDVSVSDLLASGEAAKKKYPDANAIYLIDVGEHILHDDGTQRQRSHHAVKILKDDWRGIAEIGHGFEEGRDRVTLVRARTIDPDGTVYDFDPADLKESKPVEGVTSYSETKTVSGHLSNVNVGSIVEIIWDFESYNPYDKELFHPGWTFAGTEPSVWSRWTITIPKSQELHYRAYNVPKANAAPVITETDSQRTYQWEMRDLDPIEPEPAMPPIQQVAPRVFVSVHDTWDYLYDFLGKFQKEHIQLTPAIQQKVSEITSDCTTPKDKLAAIYHWLQREIRYVSIKGSMGSGWSGHPASLTLDNGYGDCIDKAVLFSTMLQAVKIKSFPVILTTNDMPADDRTLPRLYANHAINKVYLDDRVLYLDTTAESFRFPFFRPDDHGVTTINVLEREIGTIDVPPASHNAIGIGFDMAINTAGDVTMDLDIDLTGSLEAGIRMALEQINDTLLTMVAQQAINSISPGAQLQDIQVSKKSDLNVPLTIKMKVTMPGYSSFAGDLMIVPLPLSEGIHQYAEVSLDERKFDIDYGTSGEIRQHARLKVPQGYEAKGLPDPLHIETPYAHYQASYSYDGQAIVFEDSLSRSGRVIPKKDYRAHKKLLERVADYARKPIFLKKVADDPT